MSLFSQTCIEKYNGKDTRQKSNKCLKFLETRHTRQHSCNVSPCVSLSFCIFSFTENDVNVYLSFYFFVCGFVCFFLSRRMYILMGHSSGSSKPQNFLFWASAERGQPAKLVSSTSQASTARLCMPVVKGVAYT